MAYGTRATRGWLLPTEIVAAGVVVYLLRRVLIPFAVAFGMAYVLSPIVHHLSKRLRLPRLAAIFLLLAVIIVPLVYLVQAYGPALVEDADAFARNLPGLVTHFADNLFGGREIQLFGQTFTAGMVSEQMINRVRSFLGTPLGVEQFAESFSQAFMTTILTIVALVYFLIDGAYLVNWLVRLAPGEQRHRIRTLVTKIDVVIGRFLRGLAGLVIFTAVVVWIAFRFVFHLPYAPLFGITIGLLELLPLIGPITSGVLTSLVAFGHGGMVFTIKVIIFYLVLRLTVDQVLGPIVLGRAVILPPAVVLFAFFSGGALFGFFGLLVAVPATAVLKVVAEELYRS